MDERDVPEAARVVATLHDLLARAGALRAVALLDRGDDALPLVVDCAADGSTEVAEGDDARAWPQECHSGGEPLELPPISAVPTLEVDVAGGTVTAPLGGLDAAGRAVRDLAARLGGRSVVTVGFATTEPDAPLFLAARPGEPLVASLAEAEYELPEGWPE
ncbi:MAG TPA: hypothetical protein VGI54_06255 [Solirubrobacteraceae bacterium]